MQVTVRLATELADKQLARETVIREHYLHRGCPSSYVMLMERAGELRGVIMLGNGGAHSTRKSICPSEPTRAIEFSRMWIHDDEPRNTASWFISKALRLLPVPALVFAYADTGVGHDGTVYRAANFNYAGWTGMTVKKALKDRPTVKGQHARSATPVPFSEWIDRTIKVRYWTIGGRPTKKERKGLLKMCAWACYSWADFPAPTVHTHVAELPAQINPR
jgi:hypothetical protein